VESLRSPQDIYDFVVAVFTYEVPISAGGGLRISIRSLLVAVLIFVLMYRLSRTAQRVLRGRVLSHVSIDAGLAYTLQQMLHYAVVALGVLFALRVGVGVDLTSLAVVVTALSVGIGLGLKEISSDVAAGFILLFERPVRVGDRVKLGGSLQVEGDVAAIDLRTTKVLTNDGLTVIVPNSKLTNEEYVNWSYTNEPVRLHIPIGVAYESDVDTVRAALLAAAEGIEQVIANPKPSVRLVKFGDSTLDFELLVWTREPEKHPQIRSDVNFNIHRELHAAGIEIPFPQQDLHVRTMPQPTPGS
jgi:small-conductance mechanosensitive channel